MDGNTKSIKSLELFKGDLTKILRTSPDRKSVLSEMLTRLAGAIKKSKEEKATDLKITLDEAFAKTLSSNVKSAKPKLKVEFLGCPPKKKA